MSSTLSHNQPACVMPSQAPLSKMDAAGSHPSERARSDAPPAGVHNHTTYATSSR